MSSKSTRGYGSRISTVLIVMVLAAALMVLPRGGAALADAAGRGGDFVPFSSTVPVLDTRTGLGVTGIRGPGSTATFKVLGVAGVPASEVTAVLLDVAAINPTASTFLTLWPDGTARPPTATVNAPAGQILSNATVVPVGANGNIALFNLTGSVHVSADVQGYFTRNAGGAGGGFVPVQQVNVLDTSAEGAPLGAHTSRTLTVPPGVVPVGAAAAFINVTANNGTTGGWIGANPPGGSASASIVDYVAGSTSSGASIRLSATGQFVVTNHSSGTVHLILAVQGYFTASTADGAGLRTVTAARLFDTRMSTAVPANGTIDVQVGGTNGLPTRGIAGAVLNLSTTSPTASGSLRAWPVGGAEPATSSTRSVVGQSRSALAVVRPGDEGKVRIKNLSSGTVHILVDLQGWFADALPLLPVAQHSRTAAIQAPPVGSALGALEFAHVDNLGRLRIAHQPDLNDVTTVQWSTISGTENAFTGGPALSPMADGRVQVAAQHVDSDVWTANQTAPGAATWSDLSDFGGSMAAPPVAALLADGTTVRLAVDADGRLWHHRPVGATAFWRSLGDADLAGPLAIVPISDGLRIVALDTAGGVKTAAYTTAGTLLAWTNLGGTGSTGTPAVIIYPGSRARVVVRAATGALVTKLQDAGGTWPADWQPVGTFTAAGAPAAIIDDPTGRTAVVARGPDNEIYRVFETGAGSNTWGTWLRVNDQFSDPSTTDPTVTPYVGPAGNTWLIVYRNNDATRVFERDIVPGPGPAAAAETVTFTGRTLPNPPTNP